MVKQGIKIFCRVKPTKSKTGLYDIDNDDDSGYPKISFVVPKDLASGFINNKKEEYFFQFQKVFDQLTKQDEVFEHVAQDVADNVLTGYNGTIFAYGQTGSGKTFSITGGAERYIDRGIIPRTLTYLFQQYSQSTDSVFTTHISYLEIYNDSGYDLLDPKHEAAKLEDLPKVSLMEDNDGNIHLKNLTLHQANNEEEALNLLFLGDTNRMIAETPMNQASTRSHCIFTVHVSSRESGSATIRRSKLHLVDLAGSERIGKTGVTGTLAKEAKYINLSLHYLEQVIVALSEKSRSHIPYRNSMMTSILRDSLGGNCMTSMIATCSAEKKNIDESISTCRFAQRVALIKNDALLNEEIDPKLLVIRLKAEVQELKNQLSLASGDQSTEQLSEEDHERLQETVQQYIEDPDPDSVLNVGADMRKINECFRIFRRMVLNKGPIQRTERRQPEIQQQPERLDNDVSEMAPTPATDTEVKKLKGMIQQRDNEINILVNMLKKEKKRAQDAVNQLQDSGHRLQRSASYNQQLSNGIEPSHNSSSSSRTRHQSDEVYQSHDRDSNTRHQSQDVYKSHDRDSSRQASKSSLDVDKSLESTSSSYHLKDSKRRILGDMSVGRQEAFDIFRRDYEHNATIEENKVSLKQRYSEAKSLGQHVNQSRQKINKIKSQIEHRRLQLAMSGQEGEPDEIEMRLRDDIEDEKESYKVTFNKLRGLKTEIEHLQHLLERSRLQLRKDFELWWADQANNLHGSQTKVTPTPPNNPSKAWRTPPISPHTKHDGDHQTPREHHSDSHRKHSHHHGNREHGGSSSHRPYSGSSRNALLAGLGRHVESGGGGHDGRSGGGGHDGRPPVPPIGKSSSADGMRREDEGQPLHDVQSRRSRSSDNSSSRSSIQLTGDKRADADIMAFIKARQNLLQTRGQAPR